MRNEKLISLRNDKGLSQEQAAVSLGISRSMLAMIELGERFGSYPTLKRIADFYETTVDELFSENFFDNNAHVKRQSVKPA